MYIYSDENGTTEEDIIIEDRKSGDRHHRRPRSRSRSVVEETTVAIDTRSRSRSRSISPSTRSLSRHHHHHHHHGEDTTLAIEADYYNRRAMERATMGEARHGATRDWAVVDVPPGTSRVQMEGIGGGSQEITWERYNGARQSRFRADGHDFVALPEFEGSRSRSRSLSRDRGSREEVREVREVRETRDGGREVREVREVVRESSPGPAPAVVEKTEVAVENKNSSLEISIRERDGGGGAAAVVRRERERERPRREMWTEITKDMVIREAIEEMRYGYEENEYYFYVMVSRLFNTQAIVSIFSLIFR